jgi:hypothetical protein
MGLGANVCPVRGSSVSRRSGRSKTSARAQQVELGKSFPWATVGGSAVLVLGLAGILTYAVVNQGSGFVDPLEAADKRVAGVQKFQDLAREHVGENVDYPQDPPVGGEHAPVWVNCSGTVFTEEVPEENVVHSLEHGATWVTYRPDLPKPQVEKLAGHVEGRTHSLLSPRSGQDDAVVLSAWGRQLRLDSVDDERVDAFLDQYTNGPQTPERGATCGGGTLQTGDQPVIQAQ